MKVRAAALATDPVAEQAAQARLSQSGSAVDAVLAGYFASAGAHSGVLLGPLTVVVGGIGLGGRIFDGRTRQPGLGVKRPRGFRASEAIPAAAHVGVAMAVQAAAVAHAYAGTGSFAAVVRTGLVTSSQSHLGRSQLFERIASVGSAALTEPLFARPLLHLAGMSQGGLLTPSDLSQIPALEQAPAPSPIAGLIEAAWARSVIPDEVSLHLGEPMGVGAVDALGIGASAVYYQVQQGLSVPELGLVAPLTAFPILRGVRRTPPGQPLPAAAPIAVLCDAMGYALEVRLHLGPSFGQDRVLTTLFRDPATRYVEVQRARADSD